MTFNLFFTDFVGQTVYNGDPSADETSIERIRYDQGVRAASYGLLFHCIVGAIYAPLLKPLIHQFGIHLTFSFSMFIFSLSMLVIYVSRNIIVVNLMASLSGLGMASLTSIPYTLVMTYHANREVRSFCSKIFSFDMKISCRFTLLIILLFKLVASVLFLVYLIVLILLLKLSRHSSWAISC